MSVKRLSFLAGVVALAGASGCGPWCERWCENHPRSVPTVPAAYAAPCCQPCQPACCAPGAVSSGAPTWQRPPVAAGCCP